MSREKTSDPSESDVRLAAMNLLARREHSALELREKLVKRFADEAHGLDIDSVLSRLAEQGLQSDERFTEAFITSRERQGKGPLRIEQELRQKGVAEALVAQYLDEADECWAGLAREVRSKRFGDGPIQTPREKARQMRFLQYRGFSHEQVREAIASVPRHP
ncbi:regulatory protein RecX [Marinimicrobium agarilyticum]|uniref:regulatory protein RecX n=1 Tax=Marinimicrobium agarilyticum TaxID=306546 RepID=UPI00040C70D7|nr:regulatory protein RecX [Marinimicrobium agarilyticum]